MEQLKEKYVIDENGNKTEVILSIEAYKKLLEELEELEELKLYDEAKSKENETIPFDEAMKELGLWSINYKLHITRNAQKEMSLIQRKMH